MNVQVGSKKAIVFSRYTPIEPIDSKQSLKISI